MHGTRTHPPERAETRSQPTRQKLGLGTQRVRWHHELHRAILSRARAPQVTNETYQNIVKARTFDRFGGLWVVPQAARRKRTDFEVALATQLAASEAEQKTFGMEDHYALTEHEQAVGLKKM